MSRIPGKLKFIFPDLSLFTIIAWIIPGVIVFLAVSVADVEGQEFRLRPEILVSEEYNDNILLQNDNPQKDYITRIVPSLSAHYQSSLWTWDGIYTFEYRYFNKYHENTETTHSSNVRNLTEVIHSFLYFEGIDDFRRTSLDVTNDYTQQSPIAHQTDVHTLTLHPYLVLKPLQNTTLEIGHIMVDTRYSAEEAINRIDNTNYVTASSALSSNLTFTIGARHTRELNRTDNFYQTDVYTGVQYSLTESTTLFGSAGKSWFHYDSGTNTSQYTWNGGINHRYSPYTISLESGVSYLQDPEHVSTREERYRGSVGRVSERSSINVAFGLREFKNAATNMTTTRTREVQGDYMYRLTPRTTATVRSLYQNILDRVSSSHIHLSQSSLRFEHRLSESVTLSMEYSYLNSYAPVIAANNYINRRGLIEFRMLF